MPCIPDTLCVIFVLCGTGNFPQVTNERVVGQPLNSLKMAHSGKIDVHSHFLPPFYRKACLEKGHGMPDGMPALPVCPSIKSWSSVNKLTERTGMERRDASRVHER
jgi:hypothetical protein